MSKFITNQHELLSDLLKIYIPASKTLDFLVGYFYFSGLLSIYQSIGDKKLRILVGMDADVDVHNCIHESALAEGERTPTTMSKLKVRHAYYESLKKIISKADSLDTQKHEQAFLFFIEKVRNGTLEVRKTKNPNHAKMYVFTSDEEHSMGGHEPGRVLVGSSNLSFQGLQGRTEINVKLGGPDSADYEDAEKIFTELWEEGTPLVDENSKQDFFEQVIKHTWLEKCPSPYLMYVRVLYEYFKVTNEEIKTPAGLTHNNDTQYMNLVYQTDAIRDALAMLKRHSGCIVADVVGLGKSIIASAVAANLDMKVVIICPPHLKAQWEDFAYDFGLRQVRIYTPGKLEDALLQNTSPEQKLIIVDEAHRYRNENTEQYGLLHKICTGNKVLLLSATPFNNRPEDIFSLIKLFQIPSHSTIQSVNNLGARMEALIAEYRSLKREQSKGMSEAEFKSQAKEISSEIRNILQPVLIRRTRVDLQKLDRYRSDLEKQNIVFSDIKPPEEQQYDLGNMSQLYIDTLEHLSGSEASNVQVFTGARYQPLIYLKDDKKIIEKYRKVFGDINFQAGQRNMATFMRQLLVRRFESSVYSFKKTLHNIINSMTNIERWYTEYQKVPIFKKGQMPDFESLNNDIQDELDNALFPEGFEEILTGKLSKEIEKGLVFVNTDELTPSFITDMESDIALFTSILSTWESAEFNHDQKLKGILEKINQSIKKDAKRKIIIFSEFKDTVDYLEREFQKSNIRVIRYTSDTTNRRKEIKENFDAGYKSEHQKNDYDVLVATDAISEGFSLHRAGTIYNYDIPYNPTRVIQRVGRINRINKKVFESLNIYNFFPSATGEALSRTKSISTFKMLLIQTIFGSDTKILTDEEITDGYFTDEYLKAKEETDSPSWDVDYRNELNKLEREDRDTIKAAQELPQRCRTGRKAITGKTNDQTLFEGAEDRGVLLFSEKGDSYRFCFANENGRGTILPPYAGLALFKAGTEEKSLQVTDGFYPMYQTAKSQSGISTEKTTRSKNIMTLDQNILYILKVLAAQTGNDENKEYLGKLRRVINELDSLPAFYIKALLDIDIKEPEKSLVEYKQIVDDEYLNSIIEKDNQILNETETILLAEQFI
ncbi:ATP-dependent helicase [Spirochaetia bacterium]|nr:ATP-dependent helicase [Spirochaetia bacterium]